jgi:hypothetical protein
MSFDVFISYSTKDAAAAKAAFANVGNRQNPLLVSAARHRGGCALGRVDRTRHQPVSHNGADFLRERQFELSPNVGRAP